jgi:hypothetical protein
MRECVEGCMKISVKRCMKRSVKGCMKRSAKGCVRRCELDLVVRVGEEVLRCGLSRTGTSTS